MFELAVRLVLSLGAVLLGIWWLTRTISKHQRGGSSGVIRTLARHPITRTSSMVVVAVGDHALVLGVSENQVNLLERLDDIPIELRGAQAIGETLDGDLDGRPDAGTPRPSLFSAPRKWFVRTRTPAVRGAVHVSGVTANATTRSAESFARLLSQASGKARTAATSAHPSVSQAAGRAAEVAPEPKV